jgi:large subunit ribosomal protein L15
MKFNELQTKAKSSPKRVGRGISAGQGKTAGRGTKGQKSRTGYSKKPGFEGGQNPLMQRLPKLRGFTSKRTANEVIYTGQLDSFKDKAKVDAYALAEAGFISNPFVNIKLVVKGNVTKAVTLNVQGVSSSALDAVQAAGGSVNIVAREARPMSARRTEKLANGETLPVPKTAKKKVVTKKK